VRDLGALQSGLRLAFIGSMDQLERLGSAHECFSELLYAIDPRILIRIACEAAGIEVGELVEVIPRNPRIELQAVSKRAQKHIVDLVFTVQTADGKVIEVWVFEIQLGKDHTKIRRWDVYPVAFGLEYDANGRLALFVPIPKVRRWIRAKVLPRMTIPPILIEPDQIDRPRGCEAAAGAHYPRMPVPRARTSAVRGARGGVSSRMVGHSIARRTEVAALCCAGHVAHPPAVFEQGIAELREAGELDESHLDDVVSESERQGWLYHRGQQKGHEAGLAEGREAGLAKGREAGLAEGLRRAILDILELRGLAVSSAQRERVEACESLETLERWYAAVRAAANLKIDELLG
jgi:hypothetical protein